MANPVKIPLESGASAQLRGISGTATEDIVLNGTYNEGWQCHIFQVLISGPYELWIDPLGGTDYVKDSAWSGATGKFVPGQDLIDSLPESLPPE